MPVEPRPATSPSTGSAASTSRSPLLSSSAHRLRTWAELASGSPCRMTRSFWLESSAHLPSPLGIVPPVSQSQAIAPAGPPDPSLLKTGGGGYVVNDRWLQLHNFLSRSGLDLAPRLREYAAQDLLHLVEVLLRADQRRGQLDPGVARVVGPADQARVEQRVRQEAAQQALGLV